MKSYLLLAFTFTVAQAVSYGFSGSPYNSRSSVGQRFAQRFGYSGRPDYSETFHQETGNFYGGQRDGRFYAGDNRGNARSLQYSSRPGSEWSSSRGQFGGPYGQQYRGQGRDGFGYGAGRGQVSFNAPLANTRSYNPQFDSFGNY